MIQSAFCCYLASCMPSVWSVSPSNIDLPILIILHSISSVRSWSVRSYRWSCPRGALSSIRNRWRAATLHRYCATSTILHRADLRPWSSRRAAHVLKTPEGCRTAVGQMAGRELDSIRLQHVEIMGSGCWCTHHRCVVGPSTRCKCWRRVNGGEMTIWMASRHR